MSIYKYILGFIFIPLIFKCLPAHAQRWEENKRLENNDVAYHITFINKEVGYINSSDNVYKTYDAGKSWVLDDLNGKFGKILFVDSLVGFFYGYNDLFKKTIDGGITWKQLDMGNDDDFYTLFALSRDDLYLIGADDNEGAKYTRYLNVSHNGGHSWTREAIGASGFSNNMHMWDRDSGVWLANNRFVHIIDTLVWDSMVLTDIDPLDPFRKGRDFSVIQDSIIVIVGDDGIISRSTSRGYSFENITSPTTSPLMEVAFANDSFGMAWGLEGTIIKTSDAGISWEKMLFKSDYQVLDVEPINEFYAWASYVNHSDSIDIYKYGSELYSLDSVNIITGEATADFNQDCIKDANTVGHEGILIQVEPGSYYTYTNSDGKYSVAVRDTGTYNVSAHLPPKLTYENGLCDSILPGIQFTTFNEISYDNNFNYAFDPAVKLEIKVSSNRKRRCANNLIQLSYKNLGLSRVDSVEIKLSYPSDILAIKSANKAYSEDENEITFNLRYLWPKEEGVIQITDSVLCLPNLMGKTICLRATITPKKLVKNTKWDSSWVQGKITCLNDSVAIIALFNDGVSMQDSSQVTLHLGEQLNDELDYKIEKGDSIKWQIEIDDNALIVQGDIERNHPYRKVIKEWIERCDTQLVLQRNLITKYTLEELPSFEDVICLPIRDSYDPNDITVTPGGISKDHFVENPSLYNYLIRFQNTGNDTAYKVVIIDTLPVRLDPSTLDMKGSSHLYNLDIESTSNRSILKFTFNNIMLVDSFTNEPASNGWITFDIKPTGIFSHRTKIENFVDIYFDYNTPIRTNTAFVTIYDSLTLPSKKALAIDCKSSYSKLPKDSIICDSLSITEVLSSAGLNKPYVQFVDSFYELSFINDSTFKLNSSGLFKGKIIAELMNCDIPIRDTTYYNFGNTPISNLKDTSFCGDFSLVLRAYCDSCIYLWNNGSSADTFEIDSSGHYKLNLQNICGTVLDSVHIIKNTNPISDFTSYATGILLNSTPILTETGSIFTWYSNETTLSTKVNLQSDIRMADSIICLEVIDSNFCESFTCKNIANLIESEEQMLVYPNPTRGEFTISPLRMGSFTAKVFDSQGKTLIEAQSNGEEISINNLSSGIYLIQLSENQKIISTKKVIISRQN